MRETAAQCSRADDAARFQERAQGLADPDLAALIESEGRARLAAGGEIDLGYFLGAVPDLPAFPEALDAAIDITLRSLMKSGLAPGGARDRLHDLYPQLARAIDEAALLGEALVATTDLRRKIEGSHERSLPCEFGPPRSDGRHRFELTRLLGAGSGGRVYLAVDRDLSDQGHEAVVAIKVFDAFDPSAWSRERFSEEAVKARRVQHPNVVRVLDRGVSDAGEDFIVYEFVEGGDLKAWAERAPRRAVRELVTAMAGVARGVQAAHSAGVVHCDLKPSNVLVTVGGAPKVADFGVAVRRDAWAERIDAGVADRPVGNLAFISPEQYRMEPVALVPSADIYALGGLLFWIVTGQLPNGSTLAEIARTHDARAGRVTPPRLRDAGVAVDRDLQAICARALAPRAVERYQSAAQLADDLESWVRHEPIWWARPSAARVAGLWARRKPATAVFSTLLVVVAAVSAVLIVRFRSAAADSRAREALATQRINIREEERKRAVAVVGDAISAIRVLRESHPWQVLAMMPYMDWIFGTTVFGEPSEGKPVWRDRIGLVGQMLEASRTADGENGFQTLSLEMTLAFWLVAERRAAEALPILTRNASGWRAIAHEDASVHRWLRVLRACAEVQVALAEGANHRDPALLEHGRFLREALTDLKGGATESALQRLVERTLGDLESPAGAGPRRVRPQ